MTDESLKENNEILAAMLKIQPSHSTTLWKFTTVPIYGKTRLELLCFKLKQWGALKTYELKYSASPTIFIMGHTNPLSFDSSTQLWETLTELYKTFTNGSKVIEIKIEPPYFKMIAEGFKLNELRKNDRDYQVGDFVIMGEIDSEKGYTGQAIGARINFLLAGSEAERWMLPGHCNFGLSEIIVMALENPFP